jgi:hypothetical protein
MEDNVGRVEKTLVSWTISTALTTCSMQLPTLILSIVFALKVLLDCLVRSLSKFARMEHMFVSTEVSVSQPAMNGSVIATRALFWMPGRSVST